VVKAEPPIIEATRPETWARRIERYVGVPVEKKTLHP
jgi:hypothetical protein